MSLEARSLANEVRRVQISGDLSHANHDHGIVDVMAFTFGWDAGGFYCKGGWDHRYVRLPRELEKVLREYTPTWTLWCTWKREGLFSWPTAVALDGQLFPLTW